MTLVIAHKTGNHISLSSDSRISLGKEGSANYGTYDHGIKVLSLPLNIYSPSEPEKQPTLEYNYEIGLAFAGSTVSAYTIKESIYEILKNLQYIPNYTDLSMENIAKLVFNVYKKLSLVLCQTMNKEGMCLVILSGYCLIQKIIRTFKFYYDNSTKQILYEEILKEDGIDFFGSGDSEAKKIHSKNFGSKVTDIFIPLHIIKKVIKDNNIGNVGGGLQYGEFKNYNFKIYGIEDYEIGDDDCPKRLYQLRGINLYQDEFESYNDGFHISYEFKTPFECEFQKLYKEYSRVR
jgi:hypothetical protein